MREIGKFDVNVNDVPDGLEEYMAFTINNDLLLIYNMQFMNSSLDALAKNLSETDFEHLSQKFSGNLLRLIKQKEFIHMNIWAVLKNVLKINYLIGVNFIVFFKKDERISETNYLHAINIWNIFKMNTMGDYHDLYLKTDVLLFVDVLEKFIYMCLEYYGLDPCHYFSIPGLSWDAILKMTGIE